MAKRIDIIGTIPRKVIVACSGGVDSMAVTDFLLNGKREIVLAYFDHGTEHGHDAAQFLKEYSRTKNLQLVTSSISGEKRKRQSMEMFWREQRYSFFNKTLSAFPKHMLVTCHHLDDQVMNYLLSTFRSRASLIPYKRGDRIIRPFLLTQKSVLESWCKRKNVPYITDPSNENTNYMRNYVRKNVLPHVLNVNPGIFSLIRKKVEREVEMKKCLT